MDCRGAFLFRQWRAAVAGVPENLWCYAKLVGQECRIYLYVYISSASLRAVDGAGFTWPGRIVDVCRDNISNRYLSRTAE